MKSTILRKKQHVANRKKTMANQLSLKEEKC